MNTDGSVLLFGGSSGGSSSDSTICWPMNGGGESRRGNWQEQRWPGGSSDPARRWRGRPRHWRATCDWKVNPTALATTLSHVQAASQIIISSITSIASNFRARRSEHLTFFARDSSYRLAGSTPRARLATEAVVAWEATPARGCPAVTPVGAAPPVGGSGCLLLHLLVL